MILRRTTSGWVQIPVPSSPDSRWLWAVAAAGPADALAVGSRWESAMVLRWNGTVWRPIPASRIPGLARSNVLRDVGMLPSGEAWITGSRSRKIGDPDYGYRPQAVFHRRGGAWTWERPPAIPYALLTSIEPTPTDVWALGGIAHEDGNHPLALRC